ncbi:predicted protein [Streptomyces viridosporus ATCC 14672]|uniref:Predicted protein n=1 Tax=Streptomyces viridosporus (strain ATCC 14672 / DSM 40746 / JCM 4963 / KCTC 9882 / NRRL B-12104 / FH 1290) TaxID=566461 RepID=D6A468_STRV1|nr:predicted protein [Streptomyces viridosporus ATCC 14672]
MPTARSAFVTEAGERPDGPADRPCLDLPCVDPRPKGLRPHLGRHGDGRAVVGQPGLDPRARARRSRGRLPEAVPTSPPGISSEAVAGLSPSVNFPPRTGTSAEPTTAQARTKCGKALTDPRRPHR